jgi:hypothetical protein
MASWLEWTARPEAKREDLEETETRRITTILCGDGQVASRAVTPPTEGYEQLRAGPAMPDRKAYMTRTGRLLNDADIEAMADEAERGYQALRKFLDVAGSRGGVDDR